MKDIDIGELFEYQKVKDSANLSEKLTKESIARVLSTVENNTIIEGYVFAYPISTPTQIWFCFKKI